MEPFYIDSLDPVQVAYEVRRRAVKHLPITASNIPCDICLAVARASDQGKPLSMKQLVQELPYSEAGIQYNLRQLLADGWLEVTNGSEDRRVRYLSPTQRLRDALSDYRDEVVDVIESVARSGRSGN